MRKLIVTGLASVSLLAAVGTASGAYYGERMYVTMAKPSGVNSNQDAANWCKEHGYDGGSLLVTSGTVTCYSTDI